MREERETCGVPSGIRLMNLLRERLTEIMDRERANRNSIHLYCTGPYWVAFERSAYQLHRAFPDSETTPLRLFAYPFPIVMVSHFSERIFAGVKTVYPALFGFIFNTSAKADATCAVNTSCRTARLCKSFLILPSSKPHCRKYIPSNSSAATSITFTRAHNISPVTGLSITEEYIPL